MKRILTTLVYLIGILSLGSCALFDIASGKVPATVNCEEKALFIVPFKANTPDFSANYFSSNVGLSLAQQMSARIKYSEPTATCSPPSRELKQKIVNRFKSPDWAELCKTEKLDFIVVGEITQFQTKQKGNLNVYQGSIVINFKVIDKNNHILYSEDSYRILYPDPKSKNSQMGIGGQHSISTSPEEIRANLVRKCAHMLSRLFYAHTVENQ